MLVMNEGDNLCWRQVLEVDDRFFYTEKVTNIMILPATSMLVMDVGAGMCWRQLFVTNILYLLTLASGTNN